MFKNNDNKSKLEKWLDNHNHEMEFIRTIIALMILGLQGLILYKIYLN